jgi:hypothetical protein
MSGVLESAHLPTDDPAVLRGQLAELDRLPQHVVAACAAQALAWDAEQAVAALGAAGTPVLYVEATGGLADPSASRGSARSWPSAAWWRSGTTSCSRPPPKRSR